jgi:hypothetical protein
MKFKAKGPNVAVEFKRWLGQRMYQIRHETMAITIYRVGNTTVRKIKLRNSEVIETIIRDEENAK